MAKKIHSYEPGNGHGLKHDPFNSIVGPRPIGWISTCNAAGRANLAPYSFFNGFNYVPPIIGFSSIGSKDTLRNAQATREFVWNLATRPLAEVMNLTCTAAPPEVNEFELAGLHHGPSTLVAPPRVLASPVAFECKVIQILQLKGLNQIAVDSWLVLGEVVMVHIDETYIENGIYQTAKAAPILRGGGPADYFAISPEQQFQMFRPR
jgi:flavin reductase (DIM6/NTAB) family NADH-FMN oxidoreductase RutF